MNQVAWVEGSRTQLRHLRNPSMQPETVCSASDGVHFLVNKPPARKIAPSRM